MREVVISHGGVYNINGEMVEAVLERSAEPYPYAMKRMFSGINAGWVSISDWEVEPFDDNGISMCGRFKAVKP